MEKQLLNPYDINDIEKLDFSTKDAQILLREFVGLLHEISTNYELTIIQMENNYRREIEELRLLLKHHENNKKTLARIYSIRVHFNKKFKEFLKMGAIFIFKILRKAADTFGIKEHLKKTRTYEKLRNSGILEKLKGRV